MNKTLDQYYGVGKEDWPDMPEIELSKHEPSIQDFEDLLNGVIKDIAELKLDDMDAKSKTI